MYLYGFLYEFCNQLNYPLLYCYNVQAISGEWRPGVNTGELTAHRSLYKPPTLGPPVHKTRHMSCAERLLQKRKVLFLKLLQKSSGSLVHSWLCGGSPLFKLATQWKLRQEWKKRLCPCIKIKRIIAPVVPWSPVSGPSRGPFDSVFIRNLSSFNIELIFARCFCSSNAELWAHPEKKWAFHTLFNVTNYPEKHLSTTPANVRRN